MVVLVILLVFLAGILVHVGAALGARRLTKVGWPRALAVVAAWYLASSLLFTIQHVVGSERVVDDTSMRVQVADGGPASRAGVQGGDRIVSVAGTPVTTWEGLKLLVASQQASVPVAVAIDRAGTPLTLMVTPEGSPPRMQVGPYIEQRKAGVGSAMIQGLVGPPKVLATWARGLVRVIVPHARPDLVGPVGIVLEVGPPSIGQTVAGAFGGCATLMSFLLPVVVVLSVFFGLRERRRAA